VPGQGGPAWRERFREPVLTEPGVRAPKNEEAAAVFDRIAPSALDLSGEEFLAAPDDGKFEDVDPDAHPGLLDVLMALPLVR
jgi:hypothetical protein